ncbi:MAG: fasciclin domain-containing protein [Flavobacteriales bacterium]
MRAHYLLAASFALALTACSPAEETPAPTPDASAPAQSSTAPEADSNNGQKVTQGGAVARAQRQTQEALDRLKSEVNITSPYKYIETHPDYSTLFKVLSTTHYAKRLHGESMTIFAPTNKAMNALPKVTLNELFAAENDAVREKFIARHVVEQAYPSEKIDYVENLSTADGGRLLFGEDHNAPLLVNGVEMPRMHLQLGKSILISTDQVLPLTMGK